MPLDFPSNPVQGQLYSNFYYDANTGVWRALNSLYAPNFLKDATFSSSTTARVPLTVQGLASQSANLQEWKDSTGTVLANISSTGAITSTTSSYLKDIHINRDDSAYEGGQINFRRASDNTDYWSIDTYGNTSTPSLRIFNATPIIPITIDSNGKITTPYQPRFFAISGSIKGLTTITKMIYDTVRVNIGSHYNSTTGNFTAPVSGVYVFETQLQKRSGGSMEIYFYINGAASNGRSVYNDLSGDSPAPRGFVMLNLNANDYVSVYYTRSTSGDIYGTTAENFSWFSGYLLG